MTTFVKTEKIIKSIFSKQELHYINHRGWTIITSNIERLGRYYPTGDWTGEYRWTDKAAFTKAIEKRAITIRKKMADVDLNAWEKQLKADEAFERRMQKEENAINDMLKADGMYGIYSTISILRTGANTGTFSARYSTSNGICVTEDEEQYSSRCTFMKVTRSFRLNIKRGYHVFVIGGLLTFVKGSTINREGMPCEWVEQGKAIADVHTVKGYLVRGEHIVAKSLKAAKAINEEHRAGQLARLLNSRKKAERREEAKVNGSLKITFQDSLNAGNCRPGTSEFKNKYEEAIGHKATSISISELRKYAAQWGVSYFAERAIQYAINH